jgi:hypothetical protein
MSKAELVRRLNQVHRETLVMVQKFSKEDFDRKAPAASWTARDLFVHLASWNREARQALAEGRQVPECGGLQTEALTLSKAMDAFRQSHDSLVSGFQHTPANPESTAVLEQTIRHYQIHHNDLNVLIASFRPH